MGSSICQVPKPKIRQDASITHSANGGLSTVMKFPVSSEPKNIDDQLLVPLSTAAA